MIRALYEKLAIPPELLIREPAATYDLSENVSETDVPVALLAKRGWIDRDKSVSDLLKRFFAPPGSPVLMRHTVIFGANARTNRTHVWLWLSRVLKSRNRAQVSTAGSEAKTSTRTYSNMSQSSAGWTKAQTGERVSRGARHCVVIEPHLPSTHLDGAALLGRSGTPVIGLTIRKIG